MNDSMPDVVIEASFVGRQPLISVIEGACDLDHVEVRRQTYTVKAIIPIQLVITTASFYLFEKFILESLIDPLVDKINWVEAVGKYLKPSQPINVTVNIKGNNIIEISAGLNRDLVSRMWIIIQGTLEILSDENLLEKIAKLRIFTNEDKQIEVLCYKELKPWKKVLLDEKRTVEIM